MNLIEQVINESRNLNKPQKKSKKKVKESYNNEIDKIWDFLVDTSIATEDELKLVTDINGYTVDTLNDVLYARTGYRSIDQLDDELDESKKFKKKVKEDLSYGELATIESEWEKFKKKNQITSPASVDEIDDFIDTECKGTYDTEDEKDEVRSTIEFLETSE